MEEKTGRRALCHLLGAILGSDHSLLCPRLAIIGDSPLEEMLSRGKDDWRSADVIRVVCDKLKYCHGYKTNVDLGFCQWLSHSAMWEGKHPWETAGDVMVLHPIKHLSNKMVVTGTGGGKQRLKNGH